jgi:TetR/AcrR family transcriptional repressor of bet genes
MTAMALVSIHEIRRMELQQAAYKLACQKGFQAITLHTIARQAAVSKGIVHHYFASKQELVEYTLRYAHSIFSKAAIKRLQRARSPSERLWAIVDAYFGPEVFQPEVRKVWLPAIDSMQKHERLARLYEIMDIRVHSNLVQPLKSLVGPTRAQAMARSLSILMDGCWALAVLDPQMTRRLALSIVGSYLQMNVAGFETSVVKLDD